MTTSDELAERLFQMAKLLSNMGNIPLPDKPDCNFSEDAQLGGLITLKYLQDLLTVANKDIFTREELLVLINVMCNDKEFFDVNLLDMLEETEEKL